MAHHDYTTITSETLSHEELKYRETYRKSRAFLSRSDLFRSARGELKAALDYKPGDENNALLVIIGHERDNDREQFS